MPTKKTTKKTVAKPATKKAVKVQATPAQGHACNCAHDCPCHCCSRFKKLVILIIVFCLGFAAAKFTSCPCKKHMMPKMQPVFVNDCLDLESVKFKRMKEALRTSEANTDGCITREEFSEMKQAMVKNFRHKKPVNVPVEQPTPENM